MIAESLIKYIARLHWIDAEGERHSERHVAWSARLATTQAYKRARSMRLSGEARAFRIEHAEIGVVQ